MIFTGMTTTNPMQLIDPEMLDLFSPDEIDDAIELYEIFNDLRAEQELNSREDY